MPREQRRDQVFSQAGALVSELVVDEPIPEWNEREARLKAEAAIASLTADIATIDGVNWPNVTTFAQLKNAVQSLAGIERRDLAATRAVIRVLLRQFDAQDAE
jgi:hypothetical protein